jgi:hypothetical protein
VLNGRALGRAAEPFSNHSISYQEDIMRNLSCLTRVAGRAILSAAIVALPLLAVAPAHAQTSDPVVFSFVTLGDSRQDPANPDPTTLLTVSPVTGAGVPSTTGTLLPQDAIWLQNTKAWTRIIRTAQAQKPNLLFLNGDMVMGYGRAAVPSAWSSTPPTVSGVVTSDLVKFYTQYAYWRGTVANLFENGTYVLPVPGNHETQCNSAVSTNTGASACASGKHAVAENEDAYRANMGDLINDLVTNVRFSNVTGKPAQNVSGLTAATAPNTTTDGLTTNQAQLSYSFDINSAAGLLHFVVINTDATGADSTTPSGWLAGDLATAQAHGAIKYFVFGHKPAFTYNYTAASGGTVAAAGLDVNLAARDSFWKLIAQYNATYFSGHEHIFHVGQYADPTGTYSNTPYQVLVGSGGSPFDDKLSGACPSCVEPVFTNPTDRYYAWALVQIHQSGIVTLNGYAFSDSFGPTQTVLSINGLQ